MATEREREVCARKVPYTTRELAENALFLIRIPGRRPMRRPERLATYECAACRLWHIGHLWS